jgi:hypothetical protein
MQGCIRYISTYLPITYLIITLPPTHTHACAYPYPYPHPQPPSHTPLYMTPCIPPLLQRGMPAYLPVLAPSYTPKNPASAGPSV